MFDYYEKDHVIYRAPHGAKEVTQKKVGREWVSHTRDPLPVEYGAFLGVGDASGDLEPETGGASPSRDTQGLPRSA